MSADQSEPWQSGCAAAFCAVGALVASGFLVFMVWALIIPEWRANNVFIESSCVILAKRLAESSGEDGPTYRPEFLIRYAADGKIHELWTYDAVAVYTGSRRSQQEILDQFAVGQQYRCWYDPDDPGRAVLVRGYSWLMYLFGLIPLLLLVFLLVGLRHFWFQFGKTPEMMAALTRPAGGPDAGLGDSLSYVPDLDLRYGAGNRLTFRLASDRAPAWNLLGAVGFTLFWNGLVSVFVSFAASGFLRGQPDVCLTVFLVPFVVVGAGLLMVCLWQVVMIIGCRPPIVELSAQPLTPTETCRLYVAVHGPLRVRQLRVLVICEEIARPSKLDSPTIKKRIHQAEVCTEDGSLEYQGDFQIPAGAMHSFKARHNEVQWHVAVSGTAVRWLDVTWNFPFVVRPSGRARTLR
jgi:hypothetical protein